MICCARSYFFLLGVLLMSSCSTEISSLEQPYIGSQQVLSQSMQSPSSAIQLPNSGMQRIYSTVGQKHLIQIVSNPSTGYRWEMTYQEPVKNCLDVVSRNMVYDDKESFSDGVRKVGSPGKQEWQFQTNCTGLYRITFEYRRPWEQGPSTFKTVAEIITR